MRSDWSKTYLLSEYKTEKVCFIVSTGKISIIKQMKKPKLCIRL